MQTQTSPRSCNSGSGLKKLCTEKLGTKDLSVYICHIKAFCQYDFHQYAIWKLIHKLTQPPATLIHIAPAQVGVRPVLQSAIPPLAVVSKDRPEQVGPWLDYPLSLLRKVPPSTIILV